MRYSDAAYISVLVKPWFHVYLPFETTMNVNKFEQAICIKISKVSSPKREMKQLTVGERVAALALQQYSSSYCSKLVIQSLDVSLNSPRAYLPLLQLVQCQTCYK